MLQYKIPQDVQRDDQILPFMTMKQLIILAVGGGICYVLFGVLSRHFFIEIWGPIIFIIAVTTIAVAYLNIGGVTFPKWVLLIIEYKLNPQSRIWNSKYSIIPEMKAIIVTATKKKEDPKKQNSKTGEEVKKKTLAELAMEIDMKKGQYKENKSIQEEHLNMNLFDEEDKNSISRINVMSSQKSSVNLPIIKEEIKKVDENVNFDKISSEALNKIEDKRKYKPLRDNEL